MHAMKRFHLLLPLAALILTLTSCSATRYCSDSLKAYAPTDIPLIEPYSEIQYIEQRSEGVVNDSVTALAHDILLDCLEANTDNLPYGSILYLDDKDFWNDIGLDVFDLVQYSRNSRRSRVATYPIPESLQTFMDANDLPYVMLLYHTGMTRIAGNYAKEVVRDLAISVGVSVLANILLGGNVYAYTTPVHCLSEFTVAVANGAEGRLSFYNSYGRECEPLDGSQDGKLLRKLFKKYPRQ